MVDVLPIPVILHLSERHIPQLSFFIWWKRSCANWSGWIIFSTGGLRLCVMTETFLIIKRYDWAETDARTYSRQKIICWKLHIGLSLEFYINMLNQMTLLNRSSNLCPNFHMKYGKKCIKCNGWEWSQISNTKSDRHSM